MVEQVEHVLRRYGADHRRRVRVRIFAVVALICVALGVGLHRIDAHPFDDTDDTRTSAAARSGTTLEPACSTPATRRTVTVDDLNAVIGGADLPYLQAGDVGASGLLSDDRLIWAFGDTLRSPGVTPSMVANSIAISRGTCLSQLVVRRPGVAQPGPVIPDRADGAVYWPSSVQVLRGARTDVVFVFATRVQRQGSGALSFKALGSDVFRFEVPRGGVPALREHIQLTPDGSGATTWGSAATVHDGHLYVFGTRDAYLGSRPVLVGRAPVASLTDRTTWQFWNGAAWVDDHRAATNVLAPGDGVSQMFSADVIDGRFVLVSKCGGDFGDAVCSWTSSSPVGPWTRSAGVRVPYRTGSTFQYAPMAHPEIPLADKKLAVSYSRNTDDLSALTRDPRIGRPTFVAIDWPD
ncbi:DUF4185 domain-containing protein [Calidifontibacter indicus]|uniref:DUF4185 domain-containing protein n=1 Tax=Calidifontibacter indicus TaxID=419650 RepID=UPI003D7213DD